MDKVVKIAIADIQVKGRLREINPEKVEGLKNNINALGLMQPILVAKRKNNIQNYKLVVGAHRLAACKELGWSQIKAFVVKGSKDELREFEIMENLARNDLSVSDRGIFVNELTEIWARESGFTGRGGDQITKEKRSTTVDDWYEEMAKTTGWGARTIRRSHTVGKVLTPAMREVLRGHDMLNNQKQLEELAGMRFSEDVRLDVARLIVDGKAKTVKMAHLLSSGKAATTPAEVSAQDKILLKLQGAWDKATKATRDTFVAHIEEFLND